MALDGGIVLIQELDLPDGVVVVPYNGRIGVCRGRLEPKKAKRGQGKSLGPHGREDFQIKMGGRRSQSEVVKRIVVRGWWSLCLAFAMVIDENEARRSLTVYGAE